MSIISTLSSCSKKERIAAFNLLVNHPDTKPVFEDMVRSVVEEVLITSELKPIKRISTIERVLDLNDMVDHEEEGREPTIPERLQMLETRTVYIESQEEETFIPETKLEKTALELIKYACSRPIVDGVRAITPLLLHQFREGILPKELRPNTVNPRQWKKELFDLLCNMFPSFKTEKKGNNRGVRLLIPRSFDACKLRVS